MGNYRAESTTKHILYGDTTTMFSKPYVNIGDLTSTPDVAVCGAPWEGSPTWSDGWSGATDAPRTIRECSGRLSGFLPEYGIDAFEHLDIVDSGDVLIDMADREASFANIETHVAKIVEKGVFPVVLGGDHSIAYPVVKSITETTGKRLGVVHLDAHFDNKDIYDGDRFARCCQFHRIAELPLVNPRNIAHTGIRGPRNTKASWEYAREIGATILTINDVRNRGIDAVIREAHAVAMDGTDGFYITICSDILEAAFNVGGPPDPNGLTTYELFSALYFLGQQPGLVGYDHCEIHPPGDPNALSSHTAAWALVYLLNGMATARVNGASRELSSVATR